MRPSQALTRTAIKFLSTYWAHPQWVRLFLFAIVLGIGNMCATAFEISHNSDFFAGLPRGVSERAFLDHHKKYRNQNEDVNRRGDHTPDNWSGDGFHHVLADAGF